MFGFVELYQSLPDQGERVPILGHFFIEVMVVHTESEVAIHFHDE